MCMSFIKKTPFLEFIETPDRLFKNIENFASFKNWWKPVYFNPKAQKLPIGTSKKHPLYYAWKRKKVSGRGVRGFHVISSIHFLL